MTELSQRIANLPTHKRALLERALVERARASAAGLAIARRDTAGPAPLSFAQQRMWFLHHLEPGSYLYTVASARRISGRLDVDALRRALDTIIARHDVLRTTFDTVDGELAQIVAPSHALDVPLIDLSGRMEAEREAEVARLIDAASRHHFDLSRDVPLRVAVLRLQPEAHVLLVSWHHIASDAWSAGVFGRELVALYAAYAAGRPSPLPDLPIQYADYAVWQREWLQGEVLQGQLAYWRRQLAGAPAALDLPTDHAPPAVQSFRGAVHTFELAPGLSESVRKLSRTMNATLFVVLLAAFQALLARYSGQDDVVVGSPVANRTRPEVDGLIGFFANTVALRADLAGNPTFREVVARVREATLGATAHQDLPFEQLVEALHPERQAGRNPLFQVMFVLQQPAPSVELPGLTLHASREIASDAAKFDLTLTVEDAADGLRGNVSYNTDLFAAETIARLAEHWRTLLHGIVDDPERRLADLPLLTAAERQQILVDWNATRTAYPRDACVHTLFEAQAERTPEAMALICADDRLSYGELNRRANRIAQRLTRMGVGPGMLVGLCMERSAAMVAAMLGILKAGGAYVPLDPSYPRERLAFLLCDTRAPVVVTHGHLRSLLAASDIQMVCVDTDWPEIERESGENPPSAVAADDLAYVMYTSGSTGEPKGVEIRHRGIVRLVCGADYVQLDATQTILHMASVSFDAATFEVWGALLHGARCVVLPDRVPSLSEMGAAIQRHGVTTAWLTAALFNAVIDEAPHALKGLRQLLIGGEALSVAHVRRALDLLPGTTIINGYGPTENTTFTCCYRIPGDLDANARSVPIGRPIANTRVYVLDRYLQPAPVGVPGELYIGGDGLARGYLNRPELTAAQFVPHPFCAEPGARLYRTGDMVRYLPGGAIEFLGRRDHQVKLRGFRIELGEVETVLGRHPAVRECAVAVREIASGNKELVAYVVPRPEQTLAAGGVRDWLGQRLPEYMVPAAVVLMDALPLTRQGKVDRQALPLPERAGDERGDGADSPTPLTALQQTLTQIWQDLLGTRPIGLKDDFFALGGHSLLAVRLIDRVEQACGTRVPLATLFAGASIEHLARTIEQQVNQADAATRSLMIPVKASGSRRPFFFLHGDFGGGFYCREIARHLDAEQPLYALQPHGLDGERMPRTIEAMAASYIEALRVVQPEGPYRLGGLCNGGMVAFEMARQLQAHGQRVDRLILIVAAEARWWHKLAHGAISGVGGAIGLDEDGQIDWHVRMRYYGRQLQWFTHASSDERLAFVRRKAHGSMPALVRTLLQGHRPARQQSASPAFRGRFSRDGEVRRAQPFAVTHYLAGRAAKLLTPPQKKPAPVSAPPGGLGGPVVAAPTSHDRMKATFHWALTGYRPRAYAGRVTLLWPREQPRRHAAMAAWRKVARGVELHIVPGSHDSCTSQRHIQALAERLQASLSE